MRSDSTSDDWAAATDPATPARVSVAMESAQSGDTVCFREGTYDPGVVSGAFDTPAYHPANSGSAEDPIVFRSYTGESVTILEAAGPDHPSGTQPSIGVERGAYVVWAGFTLQRNRHNGTEASSIVRFELAEHVTIRECDISGGAPQLDPLNAALIVVSNSRDVSIHHNRLHDIVGADGVEALGTSAIMVYGDESIFVHHNEIHDVEQGVQFQDSPNRLHVFLNHIYRCDGPAIQGSPGVDGSTDFLIYQNLIRECSTGLYSPDPPGLTHRVLFYNNTLIDVGTLAVLSKPTVLTHRDAEVFNNIVANGGTPSRFVSYEAPPASPRFADHNTFFGGGTWRLDSIDYGTLAEWQAATGFDQRSLDEDPQFVDPSGDHPESFRLQASSPAGGGGIDRNDIDGDGNRSESIPMGVFITGAEQVGR